MDLTVQYILSALVVLISLSIHEFAHGYAAYKLGDPTAKSLGRLTLNPLAHIDIYGLIAMVLFRIGWAKPVPINARYFKKPKRDFAICALAGPLSNILLAFLGAFLYLLFFRLFRDVAFSSEILFNIVNNFLKFLFLFAILNVSIAVFNSLPIPPFDGSRFIYSILPRSLYFKIMKHERRIYIFVLLWLVFGNLLANGLMSLPFAEGNAVFEVISYVISFPKLVSLVSEKLLDLIFELLLYIPFLN